MSGNTQKEGIYRTAMRICRMWGVAETLDSGIPPYETPIATQSAENEKLVLQWAEEYVLYSYVRMAKNSGDSLKRR